MPTLARATRHRRDQLALEHVRCREWIMRLRSRCRLAGAQRRAPVVPHRHRPGAPVVSTPHHFADVLPHAPRTWLVTGAACEGVDFVLHHAALGSVPWSVADPETTNEVNVTGFLNMLIAAKDARVARVVYASSSAVYGDAADNPQHEEHIGRPLSPYASSKAANESYALSFEK